MTDMNLQQDNHRSFGSALALSTTNNTIPFLQSLTPRFLLRALPWIEVSTGIYSVNRVVSSPKCDGHDTFGQMSRIINVGNLDDMVDRVHIEYDNNPQEIHLNYIRSILHLNTFITDIYNVPYNQLQQQIRVTVEKLREREESEIINNEDFGLIKNVSPDYSIDCINGAPTPDDFDHLLSVIWKKPSFFLAHPLTIYAFGRECTKRGVPPVVKEMFGANFITWRGIPILPCDKIPVEEKGGISTSSVLCIRVGEEDQGVVGLFKGGSENIRGLVIHDMGMDDNAVSRYLVGKYFGIAILVPDAVGILRNVELGHYHE